MIDLKISELRTFVPAKDFEGSKEFYKSLGFVVKWSDANLALLEAGSQHFYLQHYYSKEWADNCMLHVTVADAESCFRQITDVLADGRFPDARVAQPKQEPYGALVTYLWDPSGVLLHLAQWTGSASA